MCGGIAPGIDALRVYLETIKNFSAGHQGVGPGIIHRITQSLIRPRGIERNIRSASPHDAQRGDDPLNRALSANRHRAAGLDAETLQIAGKSIRLLSSSAKLSCRCPWLSATAERIFAL